MEKKELLNTLEKLSIPVVDGKVHKSNVLAALQATADKELNKAELENLLKENNKKYGTNFSLGGAYGNLELWSDGKDRLEAGSLKDCYNAFVKVRFNEKYKVKAAHNGQPATTGSFGKPDLYDLGQRLVKHFMGIRSIYSGFKAHGITVMQDKDKLTLFKDGTVFKVMDIPYPQEKKE